MNSYNANNIGKVLGFILGYLFFSFILYFVINKFYFPLALLKVLAVTFIFMLFGWLLKKYFYAE